MQLHRHFKFANEGVLPVATLREFCFVYFLQEVFNVVNGVKNMTDRDKVIFLHEVLLGHLEHRGERVC